MALDPLIVPVPVHGSQLHQRIDRIRILQPARRTFHSVTFRLAELKCFCRFHGARRGVIGQKS